MSEGTLTSGHIGAMPVQEDGPHRTSHPAGLAPDGRTADIRDGSGGREEADTAVAAS
jgi:hypothetical protein